jgi:hypothetical protein
VCLEVYIICITKHMTRHKALSAEPIKRTRTALTRDHSNAHQKRYSTQEAQANNILHNLSQGVQHRSSQGQHKLGCKVIRGHMQHYFLEYSAILPLLGYQFAHGAFSSGFRMTLYCTIENIRDMPHNVGLAWQDCLLWTAKIPRGCILFCLVCKFAICHRPPHHVII